MTDKLLYKTSKFYLIFIAILIVTAIPISYSIIQNLYVNEVDETLALRKEQFFKDFGNQFDNIDLSHFNAYNKDIKLLKYRNIKQDTLFFKNYFDTLTNETEPYRELNVPILIKNKPYTLSVRTNMVESKDLIISIVVIFIVLLALLMLGMFFINKRVSERLWEPFYQTLQQIESFEIDKHHKTNLPSSDIIEFNQLNKSIENLIERSIASYNNQQEFVENAAHELQTPIAVFKAKVDTLIQDSNITTGQAEILTSLNDSISKLNRLNKNLLLLSKLDKQSFSEAETFSVKELIEKNISFFIEQADRKFITLQTNFQTDFTLNTNKAHTEIMLNNLLLNAVSHNIQNGNVVISLTNKTLSVSNTGTNQELSSEKLFTRFSKVNPSDKGNGLGLSIVKKIADLNNWQIVYSFSENKHTFSILFN